MGTIKNVSDEDVEVRGVPGVSYVRAGETISGVDDQYLKPENLLWSPDRWLVNGKKQRQVFGDEPVDVTVVPTDTGTPATATTDTTESE